MLQKVAEQDKMNMNDYEEFSEDESAQSLPKYSPPKATKQL